MRGTWSTLVAMKNTCTCPKCGGRKLFHIPQVAQDYVDDGQQRINLFTVTAAEIPTGEKGLFGDKKEIVAAGVYEALVCAACGYAEWYASRHALTMLAKIAARSDDVRVLDGTPPEPFR
jgi:predicted nucleic-acid-binding Zn-ribbon protein